MKAYDTLWGYRAGDQWLAKSTGLHRTSCDSLFSLRNGFTAYNVISPATGFLATVISGTYRKLDASTGASGPHVFAVRFSAVRRQHLRVHRSLPRVS